MLVAGIDLSGRTKGMTAIAWLEGGQEPALIDLLTGPELRGDTGDAEIVKELEKARPSVVAVDAPLALPHAVICLDPACPRCFSQESPAPSYGSRRCDSKEAWAEVGHVQKPPMPTAMVAGIAFRGIYLKRLLNKAEMTVIETWPMGIYRALAGSEVPGETDARWRRRLLKDRVGQLDAECKTGGPAEVDCLDAIAAAYAAWAMKHGFGTPVQGLDEEGAIWTLAPASGDAEARRLAGRP